MIYDLNGLNSTVIPAILPGLEGQMRPGLSRISKVRKDHVRWDLECINAYLKDKKARVIIWGCGCG